MPLSDPAPDARGHAHRETHRLFYSEPARSVERDARVLIALGNCQAESLRLVMPQEEFTTVRVPPVHELTAEDVAPLHAWLARADAVVVQPIQDGYRGLPVGTRELIAAAPSARVAVVPVVRFAGLYPTHLIIRPPSDTSLTPPLVAYHDAAVLAEAAGQELPPLTTGAVRAVARSSVAELGSREERHQTVRISDVFDSPGFDLMRTINHPGNPVWAALGDRVLAALGVDAEARLPEGRQLLSSVHAPRRAEVIEAFGLDTDAVDHWVVDGVAVSTEDVRRAHLEWYRAHPDVVPAGFARHERTLRELAGA